MATDPLTHLEDRIQRLIEGGLARLLAGRLHPREVAVQLARSMEDHLIHGDNNLILAPDAFTVRLSPEDQSALLAAHPDITARLAEELIMLARESGFTLLAAPQVKLLSDPEVETHHLQIVAHHSEIGQDATESMHPRREQEAKAVHATQAALITQSGSAILLNLPVINLGRQRDNTVILDGPNVSRRHAQIRLRFGHYTLFDLGSTSGTTVNGEPVQEAVLHSGDVIGIAGTSLIFVDEAGSPGEPSSQSAPPLD